MILYANHKNPNPNMEKETNNINGVMYEKKYVLKKINKIGDMYCQSLKDYLRFLYKAS